MAVEPIMPMLDLARSRTTPATVPCQQVNIDLHSSPLSSDDPTKNSQIWPSMPKPRTIRCPFFSDPDEAAPIVATSSPSSIVRRRPEHRPPTHLCRRAAPFDDAVQHLATSRRSRPITA
ncbi:hypothetical protein ACLOJK_022598 [Asimina triloba]